MIAIKSGLSIISLILALMFMTGCASAGRTLKSLITGKQSNDPVASVATPRFSEQENLRNTNGDEKQYRRMNRQRLEEEADLSANAGSLWVMEGQGAYLFAQNQMRMVGDLLNVRIEGSPKSQLQTKVRVINRLLERLENPRGLASAAARAGAQAQAGAPTQNPQQQPGQNPQPGNEQAPAAGADQGAPGGEAPFAVASVPTRIVEQLKDGSYRVRGMQPFMIGKREYKVIVTGVVRPEDFDDSGIDASKLLDPQFDIVSSRKGANL